MNRILSIRNDFMFQKLLGSPENKDILMDLLNAMLDKKGEDTITDVTQVGTVVDSDYVWQKRSILAVRCVSKNGVQFIVEMQVGKVTEFVKRAQYYAAKAYTSQMEKGGAYEDLKEVIFLSFMDHIIFPHKKEWISRHETLDKTTHENDLKDFSYTFVELPKFEKALKDLGQSEIDDWAYFFKRGEQLEDEAINALKQNPIFDKALHAVNRASLSKEEYANYEAAEKIQMDNLSALRQSHLEGVEIGREEGREEGIAIGEERGIEKGKEEGKLEEKREIARNLLKIGLPIDQIVLATDLSKQEIENVK